MILETLCITLPNGMGSTAWAYMDMDNGSVTVSILIASN